MTLEAPHTPLRGRDGVGLGLAAPPVPRAPQGPVMDKGARRKNERMGM